MTKTLLTLSALLVGTASIILPVRSDNSMAGMDMAGMEMGSKPMAQKPSAVPATKSLLVLATLNPAAPQTGDNMLDLMVMDATGKPVTGLKLTTSVAMTSMDMGTTHPAFTETGGGHYTAKVSFGMDGPWRVVVRNLTGKIAVLDFNAGSKTPWKSPQIKATGVPTPAATPTQPASASATAMSGMDMSGAPVKPEDKPVSSPSDMAGMDMGDGKPMKMTGISDMKTASVPELKETGTYTATGAEDWKKQAGFGHNAPMVGMMNQMMVGGSGMEGMKMAPMTMKFDEKNYAKPDANEADDSMAGMDMSTKPGDAAKPKSMAGMKMDAPAAKPDAPAASGSVSITAVTTSLPKSGDNALIISVTDAQGKPVDGAKITASVAMTSMDMGTTHPAVTERGVGQFAATVNFSMAGPWRVTVKVSTHGQKVQTKAFDFTAKQVQGAEK